MTRHIIDLFAGPGGWDEGIRQHLDLTAVGLEIDTAACKTRAAAGHHTIQCDVAQYPTGHMAALIAGLIGSPPCTLYSSAGTGIGRLVLDLLGAAIVRIFNGEDCRQEVRDAIHPVALTERQEANALRQPNKQWSPERVERMARADAYCAALVLEPARYIAELLAAGGPLEWVALEQVPSVLPLWRVYAQCLRERGWSVFVGVLNTVDYGIPQTRERAVLAASRTRTVTAPKPTHAEEATLFGAGRWTSMAEALSGVEDTDIVNTRGDRKSPGGNEFPANRPSWALTEKTRSWWVLRQGARANASIRRLDQPAATIVAGHARRDYRWETVGDGPRQRRPLAISEAAILQGFRSEYPFQGSESKAFQQIANAVPPLLAAHIVSAATGIPMKDTEPAEVVA